MHHSRISFFLNGWEDDSTPFDSRILVGTIADTDADGTLQIGQSCTGKSCSILVECTGILKKKMCMKGLKLCVSHFK